MKTETAYDESRARELANQAAENAQKTPLQFRNWKGEMIDAPKDLRNIIATYAGSTIVWSSQGKRHQVRYALEVTPCGRAESAAEQFGYCVMHLETCNGKLD